MIFYSVEINVYRTFFFFSACSVCHDPTQVKLDPFIHICKNIKTLDSTQLLEQLPSSFLFPILDSAWAWSWGFFLSRAFFFYKGLRYRNSQLGGVARGGAWDERAQSECPGVFASRTPSAKRRSRRKRSKPQCSALQGREGSGRRKGPTGVPSRVSSHWRRCVPGPAVVQPCSLPVVLGRACLWGPAHVFLQHPPCLGETAPHLCSFFYSDECQKGTPPFIPQL